MCEYAQSLILLLVCCVYHLTHPRETIWWHIRKCGTVSLVLTCAGLCSGCSCAFSSPVLLSQLGLTWGTWIKSLTLRTAESGQQESCCGLLHSCRGFCFLPLFYFQSAEVDRNLSAPLSVMRAVFLSCQLTLHCAGLWPSPLPARAFWQSPRFCCSLASGISIPLTYGAFQMSSREKCEQRNEYWAG